MTPAVRGASPAMEAASPLSLHPGAKHQATLQKSQRHETAPCGAKASQRPVQTCSYMDALMPHVTYSYF